MIAFRGFGKSASPSAILCVAVGGSPDEHHLRNGVPNPNHLPMKNYLFVLIVLVICGCSTKPSDVPELFPCQVVVMNGTTPIADVDVILGLTSESLMCSMSGKTNSSGVAVIRTNRLNWQGNGAPAGEYIVTVSKIPKLAEGLSLAERQALDPMEQERYNAEQARKHDELPREIPVELSEFGISPYRMTVSKGRDNKLEIDISTFKVPERGSDRRR